MPFQRPALSDLVSRTQQDALSRLSFVGPVLQRSVVYVLARVLAGAAHLMHGHLDWISRQLLPDKAEEDGVARWAALFNVPRKAASFASGALTITGANGSAIDAGSELTRSDGAKFKTSTGVTISGGTAAADLIAELAGADGNCDASTVFTFTSPISGVDATASAAAGLSGGADQEDLDDWRARILERLQEPPHGGSADDYIAWALEIPGVTRAWCYPNANGLGTVVVLFMRDDDAGSPIPDSGEVAAVQSHIDSKRPVTANVTAAAPVADSQNFTISITPDTPELRAAVTAGLADLFAVAAPAVAIPLSKLRTAIGDAKPDDYTLSSPSGPITPAAGHIPTLGTITWT